MATCHGAWLGPVKPFMERLSPVSYADSHEFTLANVYQSVPPPGRTWHASMAGWARP